MLLMHFLQILIQYLFIGILQGRNNQSITILWNYCIWFLLLHLLLLFHIMYKVSYDGIILLIQTLKILIYIYYFIVNIYNIWLHLINFLLHWFVEFVFVFVCIFKCSKYVLIKSAAIEFFQLYILCFLLVLILIWGYFKFVIIYWWL